MAFMHQVTQVKNDAVIFKEKVDCINSLTEGRCQKKS